MELKNKMSKKDAIIETMNFAFPTIITSGTMLSLAGILIGQLSSNAAVCGIGQCLGRGTIMSIITVMFVLPQILLLGEKIIDKTSFAVSMPLKLERNYGLMRVDGVVQGQINGTVMGEFHGLVRGEANIFVNMGKIEKREDDGSDLSLLIENNILEDENATDENITEANAIEENAMEENVEEKDGGEDE
jgi:hypothetical protein